MDGKRNSTGIIEVTNCSCGKPGRVFARGRQWCWECFNQKQHIAQGITGMGNPNIAGIPLKDLIERIEYHYSSSAYICELELVTPQGIISSITSMKITVKPRRG